VTPFQRLVAVAALAGSLAGLLATTVHHATTVPLILRAEVLEEAAALAGRADAHHDAAAWHPHDGLERIASTALTEVATGIGFALLLVALAELCRQRLNWRRGLAWGLGGFAAVTLAPALGLPPELPGTESAALLDRQLWWLATVALTATGLWLVFLVRRPLAMLLGAALIALPHLYGAPQALVHSNLAPPALMREFVFAALLASLVFWLALGLLAGMLQQRLSASAPPAREGVAA
jgi:cobalt transporter subunit CbtA